MCCNIKDKKFKFLERVGGENMAGRGERIRHLRNNANLTQEKFGEIFNVKKNTVSQWESEVSEPDDEMKKKICKHFNVTLDWLLGLSDIKNPMVHEETKLNIDPHTEIVELYGGGIDDLPPEAIDELNTLIAYVRSKYKKDK